MKVLIGTANPGKIEGARQAFEKFYEDVEIEGIKVSSDVPDEPVNEQILQGAKNRVYIGIESGITERLGKWIIIQIAYIKDKNGKESVGTSAGFPVPEKYVQEIIDTDLGKVMDRLFDGDGLKNTKGGIAYLTKDAVTRYDFTREAFIMALTQFINGDKWSD